MNIKTLFTQEGQEELKSTLLWVENRTKSLNNTEINIRTNNREVKELNDKMEYLGDVASVLQSALKQLGNTNSSICQKMKKDFENVIGTIENTIKILGENEKVSRKVVENLKSSGQGSLETQFQDGVQAAKVYNAEIKEVQRQLDQMNQKAKEVGQMTKSILQDSNLNQKGAKDTAAQWDYQKDAIQRMATEIKNAEDAGEAYTHMLQSMAYEVKHTTGKSLFQDAIDSTKKLTSLENARFEAHKSGKKIMEDYYNTEIKKQQEVLNNITQSATNPQKLKEILEQNKDLAKSLLPEDMQADFEAQFQQTGIIDNAWAVGMQKYVEKLKEAYADQVRLNQAKESQATHSEDYNKIKNAQQQVYSLEEKIAKLQKDPKRHQEEINALKKIAQEEQDRINALKTRLNLTEKEQKELKDLERQHEINSQKIKAQNKDWQNNEKSVSALGDTIKKVFNYVLVYKGFQLLSQGIQQAIQTMKDLDKAFTDIQMVTGETDEVTAKLAQEYNGLAKSLGATTQEVAEGASEWLRQGKTAEETTQLLTASMTLSKVGAIESSEATQLLTSSLNGYKFAAEEAMSVVDKISSIDLAAATSSYELATALARTANSADDAGVSFDKLLAMIGTVSSVTRKSASTIRRII